MNDQRGEHTHNARKEHDTLVVYDEDNAAYAWISTTTPVEVRR